MLKNIVLLTLFIVLSGLLYIDLQNTQAQEPEKAQSVIVTPFGTLSDEKVWIGEAGPFMNALENATREADISFCEDAYSGTISGEPVLVVISGIGKVKAATCMTSVLNNYKVKEVMVSGTSGISSNQGARVGDLCINSVAGDFDLQHYSADQQGTSLPNPQFWSAEEQLANSNPNGGLAFELLAASENMVLPNQPSEVGEINDSYQSTFRTPRVFGMHQCIEISGDLFWHDTLSDQRARQVGSEILSLLGYPQSSEDTVIVTSMESGAIKSVVNSWNHSTGATIDFAYVRGASNFDHPPLDITNTPLSNAHESLETGYRETTIEYAAQMAAQPILALFESRSKK